MMLRKRSRATVGSTQGAMAESQSQTNLADTKHNKATAASVLTSPRLLMGLSSKNCPDHEAAMSPTSILETKHLLNSTAIPFFSVAYLKKTSNIATAAAESRHSKPVSLGILDALNDDDKTEKQSSKMDGRMVLFASQLKIQVPSLNLNSSVPVAHLEVPSSPIEFGIKNKDSQLALFSPAQRTLSAELPVLSPGVLTASISASEMELSEDYTRVITHGPIPKTTHIFDNCIVENCGDRFIASKKDETSATNCNGFSLHNSISGCDPWKNNFGQMEETKAYRDDKEVPCSECYYQDIILDKVPDRCSTEA